MPMVGMGEKFKSRIRNRLYNDKRGNDCMEREVWMLGA